ncbi:MAG: glycosyltransferase [Pseudomonadota bacterium]
MTAFPLPKPDEAAVTELHAPETGQTSAGEEVISNGRTGDALISICVPTWRDSADALLSSLLRQPGAEQCTLLIFDDGSHDPSLLRQLTRQILRFPGPARLVSAPKNCGRSHARNRLFDLAETDWVLFLDADMQPDDEAFLERYLDAVDAQDEPALIPGGFSLKHARPTRETRLHAMQSRASECVPATIRAQAPGRFVFTSNVLVHRSVLQNVSFDPGFQGWGWEDVDWGLRVAAQFPVLHIDNPATHLGLDSDAKLIKKYDDSADNFLRLIERHPHDMAATPLYRAAKTLSHTPGLNVMKGLFRGLAQSRWLPMRLRLMSLKLFRAAVYGARL